jgi:hypothetical protein
VLNLFHVLKSFHMTEDEGAECRKSRNRTGGKCPKVWKIHVIPHLSKNLAENPYTVIPHLSFHSFPKSRGRKISSYPLLPDSHIKEFPRSGKFPPAVDTNQRLGRFRLPQQSIVCSIWSSSGLPAAYRTDSGFAWLGPSSTSSWTWASSS